VCKQQHEQMLHKLRVWEALLRIQSLQAVHMPARRMIVKSHFCNMRHRGRRYALGKGDSTGREMSAGC
jgi:hypothetical protein